jgi:hypothetical protein
VPDVELDLRGDRNAVFVAPPEPLRFTRARILACRFENWDALGEMSNLVSLEVIDWYAETLDALRPLRQLEQLKITHLPKITSLAPLSELVSLRRLILETIPSWDSSGKVTQVESLRPLCALPLEEVNMFGVRPASRAVDELLEIATLRKARLSKFAAKEIERINAVIPNEYVAWQDAAEDSEVHQLGLSAP